jgi:hypothetical protein
MTIEQERLAQDRKRLAFDKAQATQKSKETKAASGPGGIIGSILSMGSSIGGMIPSLRKSGQNAELEKYQRGQGAGASMARQTASEAARRVVGASGGRGGEGNIRAGLRSAEEITQIGARQAAITASREGLMATQMLRQNEMVRRNAIRTLGAGVGQGLAGISGMLAASRDQGQVQPGEATDVLPGEGALTTMGGQTLGQTGQGGVSAIDPKTGLAVPTQQEITDSASRGVGQLGAARTEAGIAPPTPEQQTAEGRFTEPGSFTEEMDQAKTKGSLQGPDVSGVEAQQEENFRSLMNVTAEKQDAAALYRGAISDKATLTNGPSSRTPALNPNDPWDTYEYYYNEAANYNPSMQLGMHPEQVALALMDLGIEPDWERLGLPPQPISSQAWPSGREQGVAP